MCCMVQWSAHQLSKQVPATNSGAHVQVLTGAWISGLQLVAFLMHVIEGFSGNFSFLPSITGEQFQLKK